MIRRYLVFAALLFPALVLQEFAVRLALPDFDPSRHLQFVQSSVDAPPLGEANTTHRQIKNTGDFNVVVRFNRDGFRDSQDLRAARVDDVFFVGDSLTFGWGRSPRRPDIRTLGRIVGQSRL